jgi:ribulose-5-phosphate 4-epimerase/fuculose-1-phosphate aldolase
VKTQIARYGAKLVSDGVAAPGRVALLAKDDVLLAYGAADLVALGGELLQRLNVTALAVATPALPCGDLLMARCAVGEEVIVPRDTETRTFLHDIPIVRRPASGAHDPDHLARLLGGRKGIVVEGLGIIATGGVTPEQAYINVSSVYHALFVKLLLDLLRDGVHTAAEQALLTTLRRDPAAATGMDGLVFRPGPLNQPDEILDEMARVGRYTVERGLVDSFFGNISCRAGAILYISQTASSLDALAGCIDPVPFDGSSTVGLTASSELPAHRRIYEMIAAKTILHGHPRFAVIMSMLCEHQTTCSVGDCWKDCPHVRFLGGTPVVAGEIGAGGLAKRVPPVIGDSGRAIVFGHGVFTIGKDGFAEAFRALLEVEQWCRQEYFRRLDAAGETASQTYGR